MFDYCYIYAKRTLALICAARITDYDLELAPYGKKVSTVRIQGRRELISEAVIQIGKYFFVLDAATPTESENTTTISMKPFLTIFDRDIPFTQRSNITAQITTDIDNYFTNCSDPLFALSWLEAMGENTALPYVKPNVDDTGRYNLYEYMMQVSETVYVEIASTGTAVQLEVLRRRFLEDGGSAPIESTTVEWPLIYDCSITRNVLVSSTFAQDLISKITHYDPDNAASTDYYLLDDGTVTTDGSAANRVEGRWILYKAAGVNSGLIAAQFARSRYSHSITFLEKLTDAIDTLSVERRDPRYNAKCTVKLPSGTVIHSRITSINRRSSQSGVVRLTAGRTLTTLNEIIQEVRNARN